MTNSDSSSFDMEEYKADLDEMISEVVPKEALARIRAEREEDS